MTSEEIVERIMTDHWDLSMCLCWICKAGRECGLYPRERYILRPWKHFVDAFIGDHSEAIAHKNGSTNP